MTRPDADRTVRDAQTRLRLLDLAEDASLYLRRHAEPSVRVAAALLVAASLAACSPSDSSTASPDTPAVSALTQEVKEGLPASPGTYPLAPSSVTRDAQGVYGFSWRDASGPATWNQGRASLMKLVQGTEDVLEVPQSGDPILRLKPDTPITLPDDDGAPGLTPTPGSSSSSTARSSTSSSRTIAWYPFYAGTTGSTTTTTGQTISPTTPAYRNPPAADPGQGSVRGSSANLSAPAASARTWTSPSRAAATGQAGGPGRGSAVSSRSGASGGPASGAARPSSSGFSGGKSGSSSGSSVG